jgi:hypothetical protein
MSIPSAYAGWVTCKNLHLDRSSRGKAMTDDKPTPKTYSEAEKPAAAALGRAIRRAGILHNDQEMVRQGRRIELEAEGKTEGEA